MALHKGKSQDAQSPILNAAFWKKGVKIEGTVVREFQTTNGTCYEILLKTPVKLPGSTVADKKISLPGNSAGLKMALAACGLESLEVHDKIILSCNGKTETNKGNPRTDFDLVIDRPE
jgi:hypothetical protein